MKNEIMGKILVKFGFAIKIINFNCLEINNNKTTPTKTPTPAPQAVQSHQLSLQAPPNAQNNAK